MLQRGAHGGRLRQLLQFSVKGEPRPVLVKRDGEEHFESAILENKTADRTEADDATMIQFAVSHSGPWHKRIECCLTDFKVQPPIMLYKHWSDQAASARPSFG